MKRWWAAAGLALLLWASAAVGAGAWMPPAGSLGDAGDRYMPLSEVREGMRATFKTVVEGTRVESFEVDVLGVLPDAGPAGDLIMIRASDEMMERTGGIAGGMSGSPVYVDGRLIGALGFGLGFSDHRIGLLTPVEAMLGLYDLVPPRAEAPGAGAPSPAGSAPDTAPSEASPSGEPAEPENGDGGEGVQGTAGDPGDKLALPREAVVPLRTPLLAGGLSRRAFERLKEDLEPLGLGPLQVSGGGDPERLGSAGALEPGAAFGIQLARGDVNLAAIGTVTDVDGDRFIALAHPFTNRGGVGYLASGAYVHGIVTTLASPFKIASPLETVGTVVQDRGAGVAGRFADQVPLTRVKVQVWDADRGRDETFQAEVVRDESLLVPLVSSVVFSAADRALDRLGRGTVRVVYRVDGEGLPRPLLRTNLTFSESDAAGAGLFELLDALRTLVNNPYEDVDITDIDVSLDVEEERRIALIESARPLPRRVRPGDTVHIDVTLRPFRLPTVRERVVLHIPEDTLPGPLNVVVRAGGWAGEPSPDSNGGAMHPDESITSLAALLDRMMEREHNNDLIAEFYPRRGTGGSAGGAGDGWHPHDGDDPDGVHGSGGWAEGSDGFHRPGPADEGGPDEWAVYDMDNRVFEAVTTPYVLTGSVHVELMVTEGDGPVAPPGGPLLAPL